MTNGTTDMRCQSVIDPDDDQTDGGNEYVVPCDSHADIAQTGAFHRTEMWKYLTHAQFVEVGNCIDERAKRSGDYLARNR